MKLIRFWLPVILWAIVIFLFSHRQAIQASEFDLQDFIIKKSAHFIEFALLSLLLFRAIINTTRLGKTRSIGLTFLLAVIYVISDELHQSFIPERTPTLRDVLIDTLGSIIMLLVTNNLYQAKGFVRRIATDLQLV